MRSLVMKVLAPSQCTEPWRSVLQSVQEQEGVDLRWSSGTEIPNEEWDGILLWRTSAVEIATCRSRFPWSAILVLEEEVTAEDHLACVRHGADEALCPQSSQVLYQRLRLSLERRKQDWNRSLETGHLFQVQKLEALGRMAAGIAHDVRHLTQIVLGNCSLALRYSQTDPSLQEMLRDARSATQKSLNLVDRLLRFVRNEPYTGAATRLDLWLEAQRPLLQATNQMRLTLHTCDGEARLVEIDPALLEQVLLNLFLNAVDAVGKKGNLWYGFDAVDLAHPFMLGERWLDPGSYGVLTVADDGSGIAPEHLSSIFDPFFTTKGERGGTGLGLSTVLALLQSAGGEILLQSKEGQGTCMRAFFPCAPEPETPAFLLGNPVLILEADHHERLNHRHYLEDLGFTVLEARNAKEAGRLLKAHPPASLIAEAHQLQAGLKILGDLNSIRQCVVTSLYPEGWLQHRQMIPNGWSYLAKPWDRRIKPEPTAPTI